jgi:hypothetical protein
MQHQNRSNKTTANHKFGVAVSGLGHFKLEAQQLSAGTKKLWYFSSE